MSRRAVKRPLNHADQPANTSEGPETRTQTFLPARNSFHGNSVNVTFVDATFVKEYRITIYIDLVSMVSQRMQTGDRSVKGRGMSGAVAKAEIVRNSKAVSPAMPVSVLSIRAENVLKELAVELTGNVRPRGDGSHVTICSES